jgi:acid phosphatase (class A)
MRIGLETSMAAYGKEISMRKFYLMTFAFTLATSSALALSEEPYITEADIDISSLLPSPPSETSMAGQLDLQIVAALQENMTPAREAAIRGDLPQDIYTFAGSVLGPNFTQERFPMAGAFFDKIRADAGFGVGPIKRIYMKDRPFKYSEALAAAFPDIAESTNGATYPSGHSTTSFEYALVLGTMLPSMRDALYERAYDYSIHRVTSGAAYPSDAEGGHIAATLAVHEMMKKPAFQADFEAVKAELAAGGIH